MTGVLPRHHYFIDILDFQYILGFFMYHWILFQFFELIAFFLSFFSTHWFLVVGKLILIILLQLCEEFFLSRNLVLCEYNSLAITKLRMRLCY